MAKKNSIKKDVRKVKRNLRSIQRKIKKATWQALLKEANDLGAESKVLCPVDKSILINSQYIRKKRKREPTVEIGYGAKYAFIVHEMPEWTNFKKAGATRKYLEKPFKKRQKGYKQRIANYIKFFAARLGVRL